MLDQFSRIVAATLDDYGHLVERNSIQNARSARVTASHYVVKLTMSHELEHSAQRHRAINIDAIGDINPRRVHLAEDQWRIQLDMFPADPDRDDQDISELLLVVMLYRMFDQVDVALVEWLDPATQLAAHQFLEAFSNIAPSLVRGQADGYGLNDPRFAPIDDTEQFLARQYDALATEENGVQRRHGLPPLSEEQALAMAFRTEAMLEEEKQAPAIAADTGPSDIQRLTAWGMTGMMAFLSAPVAASMAAVNLARGEDFRLNTHVLSLTAFLVTMQSSGALASVVTTFVH
ncbi:hypothetical protein ACXYMO_03335 [Arenibacterium sp. CAU 1754]